MTRSVAIVGAGQIGFAAAQAFMTSGSDVRILARTRPLWHHDRDTRFERYVVGEDPAPSADVVLDTIAYDEEDVARYDPDTIGRLITISSASVYIDYGGRTLEQAAETGYPDFSDGVTEDQLTVAPGPASYSTRKVRMERTAAERFGGRTTNIRPGPIYGPWSRHPREWWFVKRIKDRRRVIPLAFDGASVFHTTNVRDIGELAVFLTERELGGSYNIADDYAPSVKEIGQTIAEAFGKRIRFYGIEGPPLGTVGRTPWSLPMPFEINCGKAYSAGFDRFSNYASDVAEAVDWLRAQRFDDWRSAFPQLASYPWNLFDYDAEDRFFDERL